MTAKTKPLRDYGPVQLGDRLGLARFQIDRALAEGLVPQPDETGGRWPAAVVDELAARGEEIRVSVGQIPDVGAGRAAEVLTERLGVNVDPDTVLELSRMGLLPVVGAYEGWPLYCGRTLEEFADLETLELAAEQGALLAAPAAVERMCIRRPDFDHLVRAGLLAPATYARGPFQRRHDRPNVPLYRAWDIDALLDHTGIDWDAVWTTPKGFHSPLAKLPTAKEANHA
jgi:hypothetical protein